MNSKNNRRKQKRIQKQIKTLPKVINQSHLEINFSQFTANDWKEGDLQINNLATRNTRRTSL